MDKHFSDIAQVASPQVATTFVTERSGTDERIALRDVTHVYDVKAYGAVGDGTTNDTAALAACIAATPAGGTILLTPGSTYITTSPLSITAANVTVIGHGAVIKSSATTNGAKLAITGSGVSVYGLTVDGAHAGTSGTQAFNYGLIDVVVASSTPTKSISMIGCKIRNSENLGVRIVGNVDGVQIDRCEFSGNFIDIFGEKSGTYIFKNIGIRWCDFGATWYTGTYSGAIKLKADIDNGITASGVNICGNTIRNDAEMGIELFGGVIDSLVANNPVIDGPTFGISVNNGRNVSVLGNKIWRTDYAGIEIAEASTRCIVANNTIDNYSSGTTRGGDRGIIASGTIACAENVFVGNTVRGCTNVAIDIQTSAKTTLVNNQLYDSQILVQVKKSDYINIEANHLYGPCGFHLFIDVTNKDCTDIDFVRNYLYGTAANDNLLYYRGATSWKLTNLRVAYNNIAAASYTNLSFNRSIPDADAPNLQCYDNYSIAGAGKAAWPDFTTNAAAIPPYAASLQRAGISVAGKTTVAAPTNAAARWVKVADIDFGNAIYLQAHFFATNATDGDSSAVSVIVSAAPYGLASRVTVLPNAFFTGIIEEVIANNPASGSHTEIWLKLKASPSKVWTIDCHFSDFPSHIIASPTLTTTQPTWASNSYRATVDQYWRYRYAECIGLAVVDFGTVSANAEQYTTMYVPGVLTTGTASIHMGWDQALPAGIVFAQARATATDTITITLRNVTGSSITVGSIGTRAEVHQY